VTRNEIIQTKIKWQDLQVTGKEYCVSLLQRKELTQIRSKKC
jgi:hypothetical protein